MSKAKALCDCTFVEALEDHYAGYWDELGLFIKLRDNVADADVIRLRNDLLNLLERVLPTGKADFTWQVGFVRSGMTIEVLFPGDEIRDLNDTLRPL
ncbi:MAG: hypothetical protein V4582_02425 [Pseudomonadota bacterium]